MILRFFDDIFHHCLRVLDKTVSKFDTTSSVLVNKRFSRPKCLTSKSFSMSKSSLVTSNAARNQPANNTARMYTLLLHEIRMILRSLLICRLHQVTCYGTCAVAANAVSVWPVGDVITDNSRTDRHNKICHDAMARGTDILYIYALVANVLSVQKPMEDVMTQPKNGQASSLAADGLNT